MKKVTFRVDKTQSGGGLPFEPQQPSPELDTLSGRVTKLVKEMYPEVPPAEVKATVDEALSKLQQRNITLGGQEIHLPNSPLS